jgi:hypothetical protein
MATAADYRARAEDFHVLARQETDLACRLEYERLAQCYVRLADLAERNSHTDIVYETPPAPMQDGRHPGSADPTS